MEFARCCLLLCLVLSVTCSSEGEAENAVEIVEGDIAVDPPNEDDNKSAQRDALRDLGKIWQDRKVPYTINSSIDGNTSAQIKRIIEEYMNKTCVQFIDVTDNTTSVKTYLHIKKLSGCWSYVGRVFTGEQELSIGQGCEYDGTIIHEFMHALGFYHEQSRPDRDDFVTIMWENIKTDRYNNFKKYLSEAVQTFKTDYDYRSVMHYKKDEFSKNGLATIVPRKNVSIGQRIGFSNLDLQEINALYQCNKTGGGLSDWSDWSPCLGSGSSMFKERQRFCFETDRSKCPGVNSRGLMFEKKDVSCSDPECVVKGHWSRWSEWSFCDTTSCGSYGNNTRTRTCTNPTPRCGGSACPGYNNEKTSCYAGNCIGQDDCEFENERQITCHWRSIGGYSLKWIRNKGSTPSVDTGPTGDTTDNFYGKGHYMYVEASSPAKQGQKARMCSKEFQGPAKQRLTFRYHSYVVSSTKLTVLLKNSTGEETVLWTKTGLERNEWLNATLNITNNYNFAVCFEYERGSNYRGDIAVDDLHFKDLGYCGEHEPCKNKAYCTSLIGENYKCNCTNDYTGRNCSEKIVPCSSNPCHNNGTCLNVYSNLPPKFSCTCADQYIGNRCQLRHGPDDCSFESESQFPCHWYNITRYSLRWIRYSGSTPSYDTGPTGDATVGFDGKGHYMYVESSSPATRGQKARICSKQFQGPAKKRFTFKYHSYAVASTKLRVILLRSTGEEKFLWNTGGLERNEWLNATLDVTNDGSFAICLEYERGNSYRGDIAVDDLYFKDLGLEIPCPDGLSSHTGFTPCNYTVPRINANPTVSVSHENGRIVFTCKYDVDSKVKAFNAEVVWYQGSSKQEILKEKFQPWRGLARLQNKRNSNQTFRLGTFIYCKIRGWYGSFQEVTSKYYESNHFFAGVLISPHKIHSKITEGGPPLKINLTSTVPVVCSGSNDCKVQVQLAHDTTEIYFSTCSVTFGNGSSFHTIEVHAKRDFIDDGNKVVNLKIAVVEGSNALDWQNHLAINDLKIEVVDIGTARCSSNGDPRLLTFDNLYYSHFQPGDHVFVKSLSRKFEVHVRTWQCGSVTCNCGIAVREGDDVIILDMCFDGIPRLRFASKKTPSEGTIVKRDPTGKSFVIKFPSGAFVRSDNFRWSGGGFANFVVQIPSDDFASTRGLCGTFDYKSSNEMLSKDGIYYNNFPYGTVAPLEFSESWKIPVGQSLFYYRANKRDCHQTVQKSYCSCKGKPGEMNGVNCIKHKKLSQPPEFQEIGWKEIRYGGVNCKRRRRRSAENIIILPEDDEAVDYVYDPRSLPYVMVRWPTKSGKTEAQVTSHCNKSIRESAPGKICAKISTFNFTSFLLQCIDDIKITDNYGFSSAAVRAMQDACEEVFLKNISFWEKDPTNNGSIAPPKEMADTLCPGLCSGHGKCEKGRCICDINFASADCSIDKRKGPTILSIPGSGGICDVRNRSNCHLTRITGHDFIDSEALSCRIIKVSTGEKQSTGESISRSYLLSFMEVLCDLGQHPVHTIGDPFKNRSFTHAIYQLQISNDKIVFSKKKVSYIIYNSKCMNCNLNATICSQKPNTCIINGYCFDGGEKYSSDSCYVCNPSVSTSKFTTSCDVPSKGKSNVTIIASATAGSIVFIALIIFSVCLYSLRKKKSANVVQEKHDNSTKASFDNQAYACP